MEELELIEGKWYYFTIKNGFSVWVGQIEKLIDNKTKVIIKREREINREIRTVQWIRDNYILYNKP